MSLRISGDDIASSFSSNTSNILCNEGDECSAHRRNNARAAVGVVYKF